MCVYSPRGPLQYSPMRRCRRLYPDIFLPNTGLLIVGELKHSKESALRITNDHCNILYDQRGHPGSQCMYCAQPTKGKWSKQTKNNKFRCAWSRCNAQHSILNVCHSRNVTCSTNLLRKEKRCKYSKIPTYIYIYYNGVPRAWSAVKKHRERISMGVACQSAQVQRHIEFLTPLFKPYV